MTSLIRSLGAVLAKLIRTPFQHGESVWGIVPLCFGLPLNELTRPSLTFGLPS